LPAGFIDLILKNLTGWMMRKEVGYCVFSGVAERRVTDVMGKRRRRNY
jgi:hypothetical protein